jgi:hypothetical protein
MSSKPSEYGNRQLTARQPLTQFSGQVIEVSLPCRERVVSGDQSGFIDDNPRHGQVLFLMLESLGCQPIIDSCFAALKRPARMAGLEIQEPVARGKLHAIQDSPRMSEPRRRCAAVSFGVSFV